MIGRLWHVLNCPQILTKTRFHISGLVINLLHAEVPVLWAIRSDKTKDGIDFWARTTPISLPVGLEVNALNTTLNELLGLATSAIPLPFFGTMRLWCFESPPKGLTTPPHQLARSLSSASS